MFLDRVPKIKPLFLSALLLCPSAGAIVGQTTENRGRNNPYSTNPAGRVKAEESRNAVRSVPDQVAFINAAAASQGAEVRSSTSQRAPRVTMNGEANPRPATEVYKIGPGDVLFVNLKNASNASGYYTVRPNGTIDFPLAGDNVEVVGQTTDEAEKTIAERITLYTDPQVQLKIREYGSHKITVSGLVERPGERSIQREAVPLYVVRAEAGVGSGATKVLIRRSDLGPVETFDLRAPETDSVPVYPGNLIEFAADAKNSVLANSGFYYIAGSVNTVGQKEFTAGMTLFQAILASGGMKGNPRKASVRRKTEKGTLSLAEYNLRAIKEGKLTDPPLLPGDMIEIGN